MGLFDFLIGKKKVVTPTEKLEKRAAGKDLWLEALNTSDMQKKKLLLSQRNGRVM